MNKDRCEEKYDVGNVECSWCSRWSYMPQGICRHCHHREAPPKKKISYGKGRPFVIRPKKKVKTPYQGSICKNAKLTEEQVRTIREKYAQGGITYRELGASYNVSTALIGYIIKKQWWKHI